VLLVDTAGRLGIDEALMAEIRELHAALKPVETLFVVDAMQGQDAVNTAKAFKDALPLTGVVLTKLDGDAAAARRCRCGRSPARRSSSPACPRRSTAWRSSTPSATPAACWAWATSSRWSSRCSKGVDIDAAQKLADKVKTGGGFDLNDFLSQISPDEEDGRPGRPDGQAAQPADAKAAGADMDRAERDVRAWKASSAR
jgi:signal recognition particle subunit SRP54